MGGPRRCRPGQGPFRYGVWLGRHRAEIEELLIAETGKSATDAAQEVPLILMILSYYVRTMEKALAPDPGRQPCRSCPSRRSRCTTGPARSSGSSRRGTTPSPTR